MSTKQRSLYWVLVGPVIALVVAGARFAMQGSVKLYTEPDKQFYLPDPDLGYKLSGDTFHWLGLDRTAAIVGVGGFLLVAAFLLLRRERKKEIEMKKSRMALFAISPLPLIIPILAMLGGTPPSGALAEAPKVEGASGTGFSGKLPTAPAGRYKALEHEGTLIAAKLKAGGDSFEGKFAGGVRGSWTGDPKNLGATATGEIFVSAKSVKTGIDLRDNHAGGYLKVEDFPEIGFRLGAVTATEKTDSPNRVTFTGEGIVTLMGKEVATSVSGTVTELDAAGKQRLKLGAAPALVVNASMSIKVSATPLDNDLFDKDDIPITVSLVLIHEES